MDTFILEANSPSYKRTFSDIFFYGSLLILGIIALFSIVFVKSRTVVEFWQDPIIFFYTILITTFQLSRILGAMFFRHSYNKAVTSFVNPAEPYEPTVTFVIPCKNEEKSIAKTIEKCFAADYPKNKLEVVVINDGSTDGTLEVLKDLKKRFKKLIIVDWQVNRGKRIAMGEGFRMAKGEIVVQLDSDSYIDPKTFRNFITPFQNPEIGAVCAHADPENKDTNLMTKLQTAYYFVSFRILKAAESAFMSVFCCSGCSSAYRKSVILPILDEWLAEKFLGLPVTWGDDRALTNWVLRQNYKTIYTDQVQAYTICPDNMKTFLKQQVRWKKGWFVNSMKASRFIFKKEPFVALTYFFPLIFITLITPFMAGRALIYNPIFRSISPLSYVFGMLLVALVTVIYYRFIARENKYWFYVFVWSGLNMIILSFILIYALATIQNRKWGTR